MEHVVPVPIFTECVDNRFQQIVFHNVTKKMFILEIIYMREENKCTNIEVHYLTAQDMMKTISELRNV